MIILQEETSLSDHVIVCGLGHVGTRCLSLLEMLGEQGVVITRESKQDSTQAFESRFSVLFGDAREEMLLRQAGVERAKAIIVVTDDDLANVSIALDAHRLHPGIAIVVRLFDQDLAIHLEKSVPIRRALSASALAAPAFLASTLGDAVQCSFNVEKATCLVERKIVDVEAEGAKKTVAEIASASGRVVLALQRGKEVFLRPAGDFPVMEKDRLTMLQMLEKRRRANGKAHSTLRRREKPLFREVMSDLRQWWHELPRTLCAAVFILITIVLMSVCVIHYAMEMPLVDSLYFVVTTITTVGYGDYNFQSVSPWLKMFGCFVMLCGAAVMAMLFGIITDLILRARFRELFPRGYSHARGHIIVAGLGSIGFRLVRDLARHGERVIAIEQKENGAFLQPARELGAVVLGNAKTEETLRKAGLPGAKAVVAVTDDDLANLSIGLAAKRVQPECRAVLRVFDSHLAAKLQHGLSVDAVLSVSEAAAPSFVGAALCGDALQGLVLHDYLAVLYCRKLSADSPQVGRKAGALDKNESALFVKKSGEGAFVPAEATTVLGQRDVVLGVRWFPFVDRDNGQ